MKNARAKREKLLFFIVKYANLWDFCCCRRRGCLNSLVDLAYTTAATPQIKNFIGRVRTNKRVAGLSLIFQVDGELKKVAGGQKKSGAAAELARGVGGYRGGLGFEKSIFANIGVTEKS